MTLLWIAIAVTCFLFAFSLVGMVDLRDKLERKSDKRHLKTELEFFNKQKFTPLNIEVDTLKNQIKNLEKALEAEHLFSWGMNAGGCPRLINVQDLEKALRMEVGELGERLKLVEHVLGKTEVPESVIFQLRTRRIEYPQGKVPSSKEGEE